MDDRSVHEAVVEAARAGRPVVLATVVRTKGSVPRHAGSRMVIDPAAGLVGTIGGGCGEADVIAAAQAVTESGMPRMLRIELMDPVDSWSPAVCGGVMHVFVEPVAGGGPGGGA
jgi:xanthine/CO dehydrogenase XdhC/CoxF family maturation factor